MDWIFPQNVSPSPVQCETNPTGVNGIVVDGDKTYPITPAQIVTPEVLSSPVQCETNPTGVNGIVVDGYITYPITPKRERTSVSPPREVLNQVPDPQPCTSAAPVAGLLNLGPKLQATIPPEDLPAASNVAPRPPSSPAPPRPDSPLRIHNRSVEEYQRIYHGVVDEMLIYRSGRARPYSLERGRRIKQNLWERLNRPKVVMSDDENGLLSVNMSYGVGNNPPLYNIDISGEPQPKNLPQKKAKK